MMSGGLGLYLNLFLAFSVVVSGLICKRNLEDYSSLDLVLWSIPWCRTPVHCLIEVARDRRCKGGEYKSSELLCSCFVRFGPSTPGLTGGNILSEHFKCGRVQNMKTTENLPGYIGCYEDTASRTIRDLQFINQEGLDVIWCIQTCFSGGYCYAGVEHACFCGNRFHNMTKKPEEECNMTCVGNRKQTCGGYWRISVYYIALHEDV